MKIVHFLLLFALPALCATDRAPGCLTVRVRGARSSSGVIRVALWDRRDAFPKDPKRVLKGASVPVENGEAIVKFEQLPAGTYAVSTFHDENNNGKLDVNVIGIPKEMYGFSNNARGKMGPPSFDAAKFEFNGSDHSIEITLTTAF